VNLKDLTKNDLTEVKGYLNLLHLINKTTMMSNTKYKLNNIIKRNNGFTTLNSFQVSNPKLLFEFMA